MQKLFATIAAAIVGLTMLAAPAAAQWTQQQWQRMQQQRMAVIAHQRHLAMIAHQRRMAALAAHRRALASYHYRLAQQRRTHQARAILGAVAGAMIGSAHAKPHRYGHRPQGSTPYMGDPCEALTRPMHYSEHEHFFALCDEQRASERANYKGRRYIPTGRTAWKPTGRTKWNETGRTMWKPTGNVRTEERLLGCVMRNRKGEEVPIDDLEACERYLSGGGRGNAVRARN